MRIFREAPATVRVAYVSWLAAVGAGVLETLLVVTGGGQQDGLPAGVAVRAVVFAAAVAVAWQMLSGRRWARVVLAAGLGVVGLASLLADPIIRLAEGHSVDALLSDSGPADLLFGAVRAVHVLAVLAATALMFTPPSNAWFRISSGDAAASTGRRPAGAPRATGRRAG